MQSFIRKRLRKEHLRLIAECRQMAGQVMRAAEVWGAISGDNDSLGRAEFLKEVIDELDDYEARLDRDEHLPPEVAEELLRVHMILANDVSSMEAGKETFKQRFEGSAPQSTTDTKEDPNRFLLKTAIIVVFAICMWVFFYSKL